MRLDTLLVQLSANPYFDMLSSYCIGQLGLYYLAGYADKYGYSVKVKHYNSFDIVSELLPELIWKNRIRLGQSAGGHWDTFDAAKLMIFS